MTKKQKILGFNIIIVFLCYIIPGYILRGDYNFRHQAVIQWGVFLSVFIGSIFLITLNNKFIKEFSKENLYLKIFKVLGIVGIVYSVVVLFILFYFRDGISF